MTLLDDLIDARREEARLAERFSPADAVKHPHDRRGRFAATPDAPRAKSIPEGSGPGLPRGRVSSRRGPDRPVSHMPGGLRRRTSASTGKVYGSSGSTPKGGNRRKLTEEELPGAVGTGPWSRSAAAMAKRLKAGEVEDTEMGHRKTLRDGSLGPYSPERTELHARIVRALLQGAGTHEKPQALFMAGGPASGKSSLLKAGKVTHPPDAVYVNPDIVKTMLPEYAALVAAGDPEASKKVHEEASHIAKLVMNLSVERRHHVVVDGVGNSGPGKFSGKIRRAMAAGMDVSVVYATLDVELAVKLAKKREEKTGRGVPTGYLRSAHATVTEMFDREIRHLPVSVRVFDTNREGKPELAWSKTKRTAGEVASRKAYDAFMAKMRKAT